MQWNEFIGHSRPQTWFRHAMKKGRIASTFLLVGPEGIGKRTLSRLVAKSLLCFETQGRELAFCDRCESCVQVDAATHPDLFEFRRRDNESILSIDLFLGEGDRRGHEGLIYELGRKAFHGRGRIAIIDDADYFNDASANCMLKTLEEPPPGVRLFLIGTSLQRQMATIRSRSQIVRFGKLTLDEMRALATRLGVEANDAALREADGSWTNLTLQSNPKFLAIRDELIRRLADVPLDFIGLTKGIIASLDSVAKEGAERRNWLRLLLTHAIQNYRAAWMLGHFPANSESTRQGELQRMRANWRGDESIPMRAINRSLQAITDCDRNLAAASLIEAWASDIAMICKA